MLMYKIGSGLFCAVEAYVYSAFLNVHFLNVVVPYDPGYAFYLNCNKDISTRKETVEFLIMERLYG